MSARPDPRRSFFAELQRRHVYKVGAMYCVAGWLLVQVVTQVLPVFDVPALGQRILVLIVVAGFPVALVLAWLFDITPQGIVRTPEATGETSATARQRHGVDRKLNYLLGGLLVLALGYFVLERTVLREHGGAGTAAASDKSIAVLPFENLSDDKANAYFAEGIQDEILTRLAKVGALKVISRTSTQQYAARPGNLPEIARQLGVANILEGSVQKAGDAVHINVQLIRAVTDEHLWAESYNRKLDDIFGVEGEVAQSIAERLDATLTGAEKQRITAKLTDNPAAYDAYLHGLAYTERIDSWRSNSIAAISAFAEAARIDPGFAAAWAQLSAQYAYVYQFFDRSDANRQGALEALEAARRLAPDATETLAAEGFYHYRIERDYEAAKLVFARALQQAPNDAAITWTLAAIAKRQGRWDQSLEVYRRLIALAPHDAKKLADAAMTAIAMRRFGTAERWIDDGLAAMPNNAGLLREKVAILQKTGANDQAHALLAQQRPAEGDSLLVTSHLWDAVVRRDYAGAEQLLGSQLAQPEALGTELGRYQLWLADMHRHAGQGAEAQPLYQAARSSLLAASTTQPNSPGLQSALAEVEGGLGHQAEALAAARRAIGILPASLDANDGPTYEETLARLQARFGDKDAALAALKHLLSTPYTFPLTAADLRVDPDWDQLRGDPRFQQLLADSEAAMVASAAQ